MYTCWIQNWWCKWYCEYHIQPLQANSCSYLSWTEPLSSVRRWATSSLVASRGWPATCDGQLVRLFQQCTKRAAMIRTGNFQNPPLCFFCGQRSRIWDSLLSFVRDCWQCDIAKGVFLYWLEYATGFSFDEPIVVVSAISIWSLQTSLVFHFVSFSSISLWPILTRGFYSGVVADSGHAAWVITC